MITISTIREANALGDQLHDLVVAFVGGTNGIGSSTARELFRRTIRPKAYIIGRNKERGEGQVEELLQINPHGVAIFMQVDISLLENVDKACEELKRRETKLHCLFLTAGYMSLRGRRETEDGVDHKMAVNYYSRVRWIFQCLPLLEAAASANELSRVISVLAAGSEADVRVDDLDLKHDFTLHACLAHCVMMTDFVMEELAKRHPHISFSHSYPGTVKTGIINELNSAVRLAVKVFYAVMSPWILNITESGERHFFQMTNQCYPAANGGVGIPMPTDLTVIPGSDGRPGSGAYLLDWDGSAINEGEILDRYRAMGLGDTVWTHTLSMFQNAQLPSRKRGADLDALAQARPAPDPPLWRAG